MSIKELRDVASKIIKGDADIDLGINIKSEIGELLRLIVAIKKSIDEVSPLLDISNRTVEVINLEQKSTVIEEESREDLVSAINRLKVFYDILGQEVGILKEDIALENIKSYSNHRSIIDTKFKSVDILGLKISEVLEKQDITEQKVRTIMKSINDIGSSLGTLIGYIKSKENNQNINLNNLLSDYGLI